MRRRDNITRPGQPAQVLAAETGQPVTAERLEAELEAARRVAAVHRSHELESRTAEAEHGRNLADVDEGARRADRERTMREDDAGADAELAGELRQLRSSGVRIKARSDMARSGEYRANRLEQLRNLNLKVLVPVLLGFAAWSMTGVHHGAARLMGVGHNAYSDPMWWALWILEPVLIGAVVWVTIVRARLASTGGTIADNAVRLMIGCLSVSVALNLVDGVPHGPADTWLHHWPAWVAMFAAMLAHAVGPAGAAATAHLVGLVDDSIAKTDPWRDKEGNLVPLLAEMNLRLPATPTAAAAEGPERSDTEPVHMPPQIRAALIKSLLAERLERQEVSDDTLWALIDEWEEEQPPEEEDGRPSGTPPGDDDPQGAAKPLPRSEKTQVGDSRIDSHIDSEQGRSGESPSFSHRRNADPSAATDARRRIGDERRQRVAEYRSAHPSAKPKQISEELQIGLSTVYRILGELKENA